MTYLTPDSTVLTIERFAQRSLPPVEHWNPPLSGEMNLRIARNGVWHHDGAPIQREALVQLLASTLRYDDDGHYYLVTPVEKWRIQVDLAPFLAVRLDRTGIGCDQVLHMITNVGDSFAIGPDHPLIVDYPTANAQPVPTVVVRGRLRALLTRSVFIELAQLGEEQPSGPRRECGVWSQGHFFSLGVLDDFDE